MGGLATLARAERLKFEAGAVEQFVVFVLPFALGRPVEQSNAAEVQVREPRRQGIVLSRQPDELGEDRADLIAEGGQFVVAVAEGKRIGRELEGEIKIA